MFPINLSVVVNTLYSVGEDIANSYCYLPILLMWNNLVPPTAEQTLRTFSSAHNKMWTF